MFNIKLTTAQAMAAKIDTAFYKGETGASVELRKNETHIQWREVGADEWIDLVALSDLRGADGNGAGDMLKRDYDANGDYKVNNADHADYAANLDADSSIDINQVNDLGTTLTQYNAKINQKLDVSGGTMTGPLVAVSNLSESVAQVRNIIIGTDEPSGGNDGDIYIKYTV